MTMTRKATVTEFVAGWAGGSWNSDTESATESIALLADQAVAYADVAPTRANQKCYEAVVGNMIQEGSLTLSQTGVFESVTKY